VFEPDMTDSEPALQELWDREAIRELVYRFSWYVDTHQFEAVQTLLTDDIILDTGPGRRCVGRQEVRAFQERRLREVGGIEATSHHNANILIDFQDRDNASVITSCLSWHRIGDERPTLWGAYFDKVARSAGLGWRFRERILKVVSADNFPDGSEWHTLSPWSGSSQD